LNFSISTFNYRALKNFKTIPIIKKDFVLEFDVTKNPISNEIAIYYQLLNEPLYHNDLFLINSSSIPLANCDQVFFFLKDIWDFHEKSLRIPLHNSKKCHSDCDFGVSVCKNFWLTVISKYKPFLSWVNSHVIFDTNSFFCKQSIFSDAFYVASSRTDCKKINIHILSCFFRSFIITNNTPELSTTISLKNWEKHWSYSGSNSCMITPFSLNFWRSCFLNISKKCLSKVNLDYYYKLLHRNYIQIAITYLGEPMCTRPRDRRVRRGGRRVKLAEKKIVTTVSVLNFYNCTFLQSRSLSSSVSFSYNSRTVLCTRSTVPGTIQ